jgi:hypothetical protein
MAFVAKSVAAVGAAAAAAAVGGITLLVKNSLEATDAMAKLSDKTSIQIEALYGWQVAADDVGVELQSVTRMSQILQRHISEAASGNEAAAATFRRLGLDMAALRGASPEAALGMVSDKLNAIENQADKTALGMQAFGRGFMENGNFIRLGSEGLEKAKKRAEELGLTLNRVDAAKLELVNDAFDELKSVIAGVGNTFAVALAPFILKATQGLVDASIASGNFKKEIRAAVEGAIGTLGTLLDVLRRLQMGWLIIKATFLEFSGVRSIHPVGWCCDRKLRLGADVYRAHGTEWSGSDVDSCQDGCREVARLHDRRSCRCAICHRGRYFLHQRGAG